jgi:glycosyltransferase involved in cell wall biosynthesis
VKILHVTFGFPPDPPGGTELYVDALARELAKLGADSVVVAPGRTDQRYAHRGLRVRRFAIQDWVGDLGELYGDGDPRASRAFERILDEEKPDVIHQHALSAACSVQMILCAKTRGLPVVFTYHTPTVSCQRGTLLEWGTEPCDGTMTVKRCAPCTLQGLGLNGPASRVLAHTPAFVGESLGRVGLSGGAWTALRMSELMGRRYRNLKTLCDEVDRFVSLTPWVHELLRRNGVPDEKIVDSPHGVFARRITPSPFLGEGSAALRIAHLGRLDPAKGTRLLIKALRAVPKARIALDIFGIVQNQAEVDRLAELSRLVGTDSRIRLLPAIDHVDIVERLAEYDLIALPSQSLETGPLVILEAFAAAVPVLGSALGGIADKVQDGVNGLLVRPFNSLNAWTDVLLRCAGDRPLVARLRSGIRPPRPMSEVGVEMMAVYTSLLDSGDVESVSRVG